ncbi:MAG: TRAP transporter large permease subunit [Alphaproteobacteria bacterium]|nr:TRAP transporter large permease subunit [Alphaproteobacteria bacterium]
MVFAAAMNATAIIAARLAAGLERGLGALGAVVLAAMLAVVVLSLVARYAPGGSGICSDELAIWLFAFAVFVAPPAQTASAVAMRLDLLPDALDARLRAGVGVFAEGISAHAALVFLFGGLDVASAIGGTSTALGLPEWLRFAAVPAGAGLAILLALLRAAASGRTTQGLAALAIAAIVYAIGAADWVHRFDTPSLVAGAIALVWTLIGVPVPLALVSAAALAIPLGSPLPIAAVVQTTVSGFGKFLLLAIPFFLIAGALMQTSGLAERLARFATSCVGHVRGGMAQATLLTNVLFSGVSGSSIADAAFGAKALAPALRSAGYPAERAAAIVAATSVLPNIIPPSIAFLILAHATSLSVGALFTGGLIGGLFLAAALAVTLYAGGKVERGGRERADATTRTAATLGAIPVFGLAVVILLGIRLGVVTPTEAAAVAADYALMISAGLYRSVGFRDLYGALMRSMRVSASIGMLIAGALVLNYIVTIENIPELLKNLISGWNLSQIEFLILVNVILLILGCILEGTTILLVIVPVLLPTAKALGIDMIHFGVVAVFNIMLGLITPPYGLLLFIMTNIAKVPLRDLVRDVLPFLWAMIAALALITFVPETVLWLPRAMGYQG